MPTHTIGTSLLFLGDARYQLQDYNIHDIHQITKHVEDMSRKDRILSRVCQPSKVSTEYNTSFLHSITTVVGSTPIIPCSFFISSSPTGYPDMPGFGTNLEMHLVHVSVNPEILQVPSHQ